MYVPVVYRELPTSSCRQVHNPTYEGPGTSSKFAPSGTPGNRDLTVPGVQPGTRYQVPPT